jgi:uncharacterized membrane protein (DUF2068 family)
MPPAKEKPPQPPVVLRPTPLSLAAWLSLVMAAAVLYGGRAAPPVAVALAAPCLIAASGMFRGARWGWRMGFAAAAVWLALTVGALAARPAAGALYALALAAAYLACLLAPSTRRFLRTGRRDPE